MLCEPGKASGRILLPQAYFSRGNDSSGSRAVAWWSIQWVARTGACLQPASCCFSSKATDWLEILQSLLFSPCTELQHRGIVVVRNMMAADREVAIKLMESEMLEILSVATRAEDKPQVAQLAQECLAHAVSYGLIKPNAAAGE